MFRDLRKLPPSLSAPLVALVFAATSAGQVPDEAPQVPDQMPATALAAALGMPIEERGVNEFFVAEVAAGSPAAQAGVQPGDTLLTLEGERVKALDQAINIKAASAPGKKVRATVERGQEVLSLSLDLPAREAPMPPAVAPPVQNANLLGLVLEQQPGGPVVISEVAAGTPAAGSGLVEGDILTSVVGQRVASLADLASIRPLVAQREGGDLVRVTARRGLNEQPFVIILPAGFEATPPPAADVPLVEPPAEPVAEPAPAAPRADVSVVFCMQVQPIPEGGVRVMAVMPDSPAAKAGIRPGDVIVGLNQTRIEAVDELAAFITDQEEGDAVSFKVVRAGEPQAIEVTMAPCEYEPREVARPVIDDPDLEIERLRAQVDALQKQSRQLRSIIDDLSQRLEAEGVERAQPPPSAEEPQDESATPAEPTDEPAAPLPPEPPTSEAEDAVQPNDADSEAAPTPND